MLKCYFLVKLLLVNFKRYFVNMTFTNKNWQLTKF